MFSVLIFYTVITNVVLLFNEVNKKQLKEQIKKRVRERVREQEIKLESERDEQS